MLPQRLKFLGRLNYDLDHWRNSLAIIGLPISVGVGIYTGVLLGAVQSRPFWNTNLVAQLFLFSGLSTGCAALIRGLAGRNESAEELRLLHGLETCICPLASASGSRVSPLFAKQAPWTKDNSPPLSGRQSHHGIVLDPSQGELGDGSVQSESSQLRLGRVRRKEFQLPVAQVLDEPGQIQPYFHVSCRGPVIVIDQVEK